MDPEFLRRLEQQASLIRQLQGSLNGMRVVRGSVASDGSINSGDGFSVTKGATGVYTINFTEGFSAAASMTVTLVATGSAALVRFTGGDGISSLQLTSISTAGAGTDSAFHFIAIGPA